MNVSQTLSAGLLVALLLVSGTALAICNGTNENTAVASSTPTTDFVDHGDGTVTHTPTGLMWKRCSEGQTWNGSTCTGTATTYTWQNALTHADEQSFAGHSDWRLPNSKELRSIVERRCWSPAINTAIFPATSTSWFWSSSPYANYTGNAWYVGFHYGLVDASSPGSSLRVRLVRAGQ